MSVNAGKRKTDLITRKRKGGAGNEIPEPRIAVVNTYTLIGSLYCVFASVLFFYAASDNFLGVAHVIAFACVLINYLVLLHTEKYKLASNILLGIGAVVVVILFATGGWEHTGYLWPLVYLPFAFFLTEKTTGLLWAVIICSGSLMAMMLHITGSITGIYTTAEYVEYFAGLVMITAALYIFSRAVVKRDEFLSYTNALLHAAPDAVIVIDEQGQITRWNEKAESVFGWKADEVMGRLLSAIIIPLRYREAHKQGLKHFLATGEGPVLNKTIEIKALKKNGEEFDVALSISPVLIKEKYQFIGFVRDITGEKKVEEKFRSLLESAPDAMVIVNREGVVQLVNAQTEKLFGYGRNEIVGKPVEILIPKRFAGVHVDHRRGYFAHPNIRGMGEGLELFGAKKNGEEFPVEISLSPLETEEGLLVSAAIRDITEKKRLQKNLMEANADLETKILQRTEQLETQKAELEQFAYIASHDLQEPLRMVASYMQLLKNRYRDKLDADAHEFIHFAVDGAARMKQLVSDLLNYSRTGRELQVAEVDISAILGDVKKNLAAGILESNAKINYDGMPVIKADRTQLTQLFQNLISNAIKFKKDDDAPVVRVNASQEKSQWKFSVSDNGIGIEKEYSDKIFIIFKQLNDKAKYGGTGIGLAIAKKIVERHKGKIWFESELGKGTTFFFTLKNV